MESSKKKDLHNDVMSSLSHINLTYGSLQVLEDISLNIYKGEIHALVGEHGAGKTSICYMLAGIIKPSSGSIYYNGKDIDNLNLERRERIGIAIVNQYNSLFEDLTVADNLFVDHNNFFKNPFYNKRRQVREAQEYVNKCGFDIDVSVRIRDLNLSDRTLIDILKNIYTSPDLLILDEILDKLNPEKLNKMIGLLQVMKSQGKSILFVTHRIDDIYQSADRVTIIRDCKILISDSIKNIDKINLIKLAYTQLIDSSNFDISPMEFNNLLKYNEAILQKLPIQLIVIDGNKVIKYMNEYSRRKLQVGLEDQSCLSLEKAFGDEQSEEFLHISDDLPTSIEKTKIDIRIFYPDHTTINNITINPIYDGSVLIGNMLIIEDITEREKLREQIMLSEKLASIGLLSAGVAHEINNPLETIHNFVEYIKNTKSYDSTILEYIDEEITSISSIVNNLRAWSNDKNLKSENIDLNRNCEELISLLEYNKEFTDTVFSFTYIDDPIVVRMNRYDFKQVFLNIVKNSIDAMPKGGRINIRTRVRKDKEQPMAEILFRDNGPGIKTLDVNSVFLPFFSTKAKDSVENMGLGLFVTYGIVSKYHGSIEVDQETISGCTFRVCIPIYQ